MTVWTVGHSTRTGPDFRTLLAAHGIELVADVRRFPASRRWPQFATATLGHDLASVGIEYHWLPTLGGRRAPMPGSANGGWKHPSFRGYADHLATEEFAEGLFELLFLARGLRTTVMCAELLWWRCHRRLIADVLVVLGVQVLHIRDAAFTQEHRIAAPARVVRGVLSYPSV